MKLFEEAQALFKQDEIDMACPTCGSIDTRDPGDGKRSCTQCGRVYVIEDNE